MKKHSNQQEKQIDYSSEVYDLLKKMIDRIYAVVPDWEQPTIQWWGKNVLDISNELLGDDLLGDALSKMDYYNISLTTEERTRIEEIIEVYRQQRSPDSTFQ